ncbi:MAG: hypothetical protein ABIQ56_03890 [Chitinophagaceae bacterium]
MTSNKIILIAITAIAGIALVQYFSMSYEERQKLIDDIKKRLHELIDDAENTGERAKNYLSQLQSSDQHWMDKLVVIKKLVDEVRPQKFSSYTNVNK